MEALREYATALAASGHLKEALASLDEAEVLFARGGLEYYTLATRLQRSEVHLLMNSFTEAYQEANTLKILFDKRGLVARSLRASLIIIESLLSQTEQQREIEQRD